MSPNYPNTYPNDVEETWLIAAPTGSIINLQFLSFNVRFIVDVESIKLKLNMNLYLFCFTD